MDAMQTPLNAMHEALGAKMVEFSGWMLPLWYPTGQSIEHHAVRRACGLFDVCHMGEIEITGKNSLDFLNRMLTNHVHTMEDGQALYNFMLNESGGVVDDCILYRFNAERWMLVDNAANHAAVWSRLMQYASGDVYLEDISHQVVKIDLQGPNAPRLLSRWIDKEILSGLRFFRFLSHAQIGHIPVIVSRTGYTGEIGFELYTDPGNGKDLWNLLLKEGKSLGLLPCGLGARDTLRVEAGLPLHGHELRADRPAVGHPWEFVFDWESEFIGKPALIPLRESGAHHKVIPFRLSGRRKAMPGWEIRFNGKKQGEVLTGVLSPTLKNAPIGFALIRDEIREDAAWIFKQPGRDAWMEGGVGEIPYVALTSRKKMADFL